MTMKDALDRAKRLRLERQAEQAHQESAAPQVPARPEASPIVSSVLPAIQLEPLQTVEISAAACERNKVLLSASQLQEMPQADAAYRLLRSRVQQSLKRSNWFSLAVASPGPNDGKTVTALNLAISIAREKQRPVYVLDLDMRNPSVCSYLGVEGVRPLPEYFTSDAGPEDVLFQTSVSHLIVAGGREPVQGASEMLSGRRLEQLLAHIRLRSPDALVIMDLPPVNVTDEALVVAPQVDAMLVVVSEGKTKRQDLARALGVLSEATIAGVIINHSSDHHAVQYDTYLA